MNDNYLVLNGKRVDLTDEQIAMLGLKKESPFDIEEGDSYYYITNQGDVRMYRNCGEEYDGTRIAVANACRDKKLMEQRAMHETLDRLLWRFACENGELENPWDGKTMHAFIYKAPVGFGVDWSIEYKYGVVSFPSEEIARQAVDEIVLPFMKEYPDFVW